MSCLKRSSPILFLSLLKWPNFLKQRLADELEEKVEPEDDDELSRELGSQEIASRCIFKCKIYPRNTMIDPAKLLR